MWTRRSTLTSMTLVLCACAGTPGADPGPQAAMAQFKRAFNQQDAAGVAAVFSADAKLLAPGKPMLTGIDNIRAYWQGAFDAGVSHIEKTPIEIIVSGDLATETSSYVVNFKDKQIAGKDTLVWRRGTNRAWTIASDIWNGDN